MARLELLGHRVTVYKQGIVWTNPETGAREMLGKTRAEALECLQRLLPVKPRRRETPEGMGDDAARLYRAHWRAYYYAQARSKRASRSMMGKGEFERLIQRAAGRCEVSGIAFSCDRPRPGAKALWAPSIDRIRSSGDYSLENSRLVCVAVNLALNEFGSDVLLRIADSLVKRSQT